MGIFDKPHAINVNDSRLSNFVILSSELSPALSVKSMLFKCLSALNSSGIFVREFKVKRRDLSAVSFFIFVGISFKAPLDFAY